MEYLPIELRSKINEYVPRPDRSSLMLVNRNLSDLSEDLTNKYRRLNSYLRRVSSSFKTNEFGITYSFEIDKVINVQEDFSTVANDYEIRSFIQSSIDNPKDLRYQIISIGLAIKFLPFCIEMGYVNRLIAAFADFPEETRIRNIIVRGPGYDKLNLLSLNDQEFNETLYDPKYYSLINPTQVRYSYDPMKVFEQLPNFSEQDQYEQISSVFNNLIDFEIELSYLDISIGEKINRISYTDDRYPYYVTRYMTIEKFLSLISPYFNLQRVGQIMMKNNFLLKPASQSYLIERPEIMRSLGLDLRPNYKNKIDVVILEKTYYSYVKAVHSVFLTYDQNNRLIVSNYDEMGDIRTINSSYMTDKILPNLVHPLKRKNLISLLIITNSGQYSFQFLTNSVESRDSLLVRFIKNNSLKSDGTLRWGLNIIETPEITRILTSRPGIKQILLG